MDVNIRVLDAALDTVVTFLIWTGQKIRNFFNPILEITSCSIVSTKVEMPWLRVEYEWGLPNEEKKL